MLVTHLLDATLSGSPASATTAMLLNIAPDPLCVGLQATLTATVTAEDGEPTGTVTFYEGDTLIGNATLVDGIAVLYIDNFDLGTHEITAYYDGDDTHDASQATAMVEVIDDPDICGEEPPSECGFTDPNDHCTVPCVSFPSCETNPFQH